MEDEREGLFARLLIYGIIFYSVEHSGANSAISKEDLLFKKLQASYSGSLARPIRNVSEAVRINVTASLLQILDVDAKEQSISISAYLGLKWFEPRLEWDPADYDGVSTVIVEAKDIWVPDIGLINSLDGDFDFSKEKKFRVSVRSDGTVEWYPGGTLRIPCPLDLTYFPFDKQKCTFIFSSWAYQAAALKLYAESAEMVIAKMVSQTEWGVGHIDLHTAEIRPVNPKDSPQFSFLFISLASSRDPMFYVISIILPAIIISLLVLTVFFLPCESGEKVSLGITILLAFTVFQLVVGETLPPNTKATPLVVIYLTVLMSTTGISTVVSVFVLNIYHRESDTKLPRCARFIIYNILAKVICYKTYHKLRSSDKIAAHQRARLSLPADIENHCYNINNEMAECKTNDGQDNDLERSVGEIVSLLEELNNRLEVNEKKRHFETEIQSEWREAANVVDRFLMLVYFVAVLCITTAFLVIIEGWGPTHVETPVKN